jgi:hypothetical protein
VYDRVESNTEKHCHEDDLQDIALDKWCDHAVGRQMSDEPPPLLGLSSGDHQ